VGTDRASEDDQARIEEVTMLSSAVLAGVLSASISTQTSVTTWLVFDPSSDNRLTIEEPADLGGPTGTRLVGGVLATFSFDATKLLLHLPLTASTRGS
jgi:hypothetical protein